MATKFAPNIQRLRCGRLCCSNMGTQTCSACFRIDYCSVECQKMDWEIHKKYCTKQMNRRLRLFYLCPKQAAAISECLDTAEDYLSRDPELASRLRVSNYFLNCIESLHEKLNEIGDEKNFETMLRDLFLRLKSTTLGRIKDAVESGRVCTDDEAYNFSDSFATIYTENLLLVHRHTIDSQCRFDCLLEALNVARSLKDGERKTVAVVNVLLKISQHYEAADDYVKAAETLEEAYVCISERSGPEDFRLQQITLQLCRHFARLGEYDRMLEYLHVALDNMKCHPDSTYDFDVKATSLVTAVFVIRSCADALPVDHAERKAIYAEALQLAYQFLQAQIDYTKAKPDIYLFDREVCLFTSIPDDIDDYNKPLKLLQQVYDIYLRKGTMKLLVGVAKDFIVILNRISIRLKRGSMLPSSLDWDVIVSFISDLKSFSDNKSVRFDGAEAREKLQQAEGSGDFYGAAEASTWLVVSQVQTMIKEFQFIYDDILQLRPPHAATDSK